MTEGIGTIIYPVKDVAQAKRLYAALLGVEPFVDSPYYVGFKVGSQHLGLLPNGHALGMTAPLAYWHVTGIHETLRVLLAAGAQAVQDVKDVGGGQLVASVKDADGNVIGLIQAPAAATP